MRYAEKRSNAIKRNIHVVRNEGFILRAGEVVGLLYVIEPALLKEI